jgi:hypothetical protein
VTLRVHSSTPSTARILSSSAAFMKLARSFLTISNHEPFFTLVALAKPTRSHSLVETEKPHFSAFK